MTDSFALYLLAASQAAQWVLLVRHLLQCRDVRLDLYRIKVHIGMIRP